MTDIFTLRIKFINVNCYQVGNDKLSSNSLFVMRTIDCKRGGQDI